MGTFTPAPAPAWGRSQVSRILFVAACMAGLVCAPPCGAEADPALPAAREADLSAEDSTSDSRYYVFFGSVNNYPRLVDAEEQIDAEINGSLRLLAPGFEDIRTFSDQRDDGMIWNFFFGAGYELSDHWDIFVQMGYAAGEVHTEATDLSWFVLPLHTDVVLERSSFFIGPGIAYHPFGMAERGEYDGIWARIRGARPFISASLHWNYQTFNADVKAGFRPFGNIYNVEEDLEWSVMSAGLTVGADIPISEDDVLAVNLQYTIFFKYGSDFSGLAVSVFWKRYF